MLVVPPTMPLFPQLQFLHHPQGAATMLGVVVVVVVVLSPVSLSPWQSRLPLLSLTVALCTTAPMGRPWPTPLPPCFRHPTATCTAMPRVPNFKLGQR
jgi:hypothetical protein